MIFDIDLTVRSSDPPNKNFPVHICISAPFPITEHLKYYIQFVVFEIEYDGMKIRIPCLF